MMTIARITARLAVPVVLACAGCAQMKVEVHTLDTEFWRSDSAVRTIALDEADAAVALRSRLRKERDAIGRAVEAAAASAIGSVQDQLVPTLVAGGVLAEDDVAASRDRELAAMLGALDEKMVSGRLEAADAALQAGVDAISAARLSELARAEIARLGSLGKRPSEDLAAEAAPVPLEAYRAALGRFAAARFDLADLAPSAVRRVQDVRDELVRLYRDQFGGQMEGDARLAFASACDRIVRTPLVVAEPAAVRSIEAATDPVTRGLSLLADPQAALVINAPRTYWQGRLNEAFARGDLGDVDIAIEMAGQGSFKIKGVRLDAEAVARAAFQAARYSVGTVAALYGVPTGLLSAPPPPPARDDGPDDPGGSPEVLADDDPTLVAVRKQTEIRASREAAANILEAIATRAAVIDDENLAADPRRTAIREIKQAFDANREALVGAAD